MVYFGSDMTYALIGKNATASDIAEIRHQLGWDQPILERYLNYLREIFSFDFGRSNLSHEKISDIFRRAMPISLALNLPGFVIGNVLAVLLSLCAAVYQGRFLDKLIMFFSSIGMSLSFLIVIIGVQILFCSSFGLSLFPVQGWDMSSLSSYFQHVFVPTFATVFVTLGYNTRFFRAIMVEESGKQYVRLAFSLGSPTWIVMMKGVLKNALIPVLTRVIFSIPFIFMEGSILLESFFGIPGMGGVTYNAVASGDLPVLKAVVSFGTLLYILILVLADILYKFVDPRISLISQRKV
jgi:peptide/nickel transport system permease protein